jgi:hypothetical protein
LLAIAPLLFTNTSHLYKSKQIYYSMETMEMSDNSHKDQEPSGLSQFESFEQNETHTTVTLLLTLDALSQIEPELMTIHDKDELNAALGGVVQFALLSPRISGLRVEDRSGFTVDTILPDSFTATRNKTIKIADPGEIRRVGLKLTNAKADALKQLADDNNCLMGDVFTVGVALRGAAKSHYRQNHRIIAVLPHDDRQYSILPLS